MTASEEKAKKVRLLEETRARRAELQAQIGAVQNELAQERTSRLIGEGGGQIPVLQKKIGKLEREVGDLEGVDRVLEKQIEELERQEHQEAVRQAEEQKAAAIHALEEALAAYRQKRLEILEAAYRLDETREKARSAYMRWIGLTGTPWSPTGINLYYWDSLQVVALGIFKQIIDGHKAAEEMEKIRRRNPQLYGITVDPDGASEPGGGEGRH